MLKQGHNNNKIKVERDKGTWNKYMDTKNKQNKTKCKLETKCDQFPIAFLDFVIGKAKRKVDRQGRQENKYER